MEELRRKRGRPRKDGAKRIQLNLRVTEDFYNELKEYSKWKGLSYIDYIMEGVKLFNEINSYSKANTENDDEQYYDDEYFDEYDDDDIDYDYDTDD